MCTIDTGNKPRLSLGGGVCHGNVRREGGGGGGVASVMSDGGVGGLGYVIFLLMQTPRSGGPQGGPDSELRGPWPLPRTATGHGLNESGNVGLILAGVSICALSGVN